MRTREYDFVIGIKTGRKMSAMLRAQLQFIF